jgi:uncharacterized protein YbjT (DUF2867 family)
MTKILILGANGQIAKAATELFLKDGEVRLTLYLRNAKRLHFDRVGKNVQVVEGDVLDGETLERAMKGQEVVYANLAGDLEEQARSIFVSSMGIYDEVPGERFGAILDPYRNAAKVIEASGLDYTIVRPAWLNNRSEISYGTTRKGEAFKNPSEEVSRRSVADLVVKLATTPNLEVRSSLGVHRES